MRPCTAQSQLKLGRNDTSASTVSGPFDIAYPGPSIPPGTLLAWLQR